MACCGGDWCLVVPLVFKTSVGLDKRPGWVRFPFTSAIFCASAGPRHGHQWRAVRGWMDADGR